MSKYISLDWLVEYYFDRDVDYYGKYVREDLLSEDTPTIEVSEDCISRAEAIKEVKALPNTDNGYSDVYDKACFIGVLEELPNVAPNRAEGEWILSDLQSRTDNDNGNYAYVCTNCNHTDIHAKTQKVPYCWWCGAKMKGADDEA